MKSLIITLNQFLENTLNPKNSDRVPTTDINSPRSFLRVIKNQENKNLLNILNSMNDYFFVKNEYLLAHADGLMITNRRYFIHIDNYKLSIPLNKIKSYTNEGNQAIIKYLSGNEEKVFYLTRWLKVPVIRNAAEAHKNDADFQNEDIIALITQPKSTFNFGDIEKDKPISPRVDYSSLIGLCILISFIGGCYYIMNRDTSSIYGIPVTTSTGGSDHYNKITGKKQVKCSWCGGQGKQGIAGESASWCEIHGGFGIWCLRCSGTGYVDEDSEK